jgi:hypothetical protein
MKRDMDLIRLILLRLEEKHIGAGDVYYMDWTDPELAFDGYSMDEMVYNLEQIQMSGFINSPNGAGGLTGLGYAGLTPRGHEFLDEIRSPKVWQLTKDGMQKAGVFGLEIVGQIARHYVREIASKTLGFDIS